MASAAPRLDFKEMISDIDIANMALDAIHVSNIGSFDDKSKQAEKCRLWYPIIRDALIQESFWTFADTEVQLTSTDASQFPSSSYEYAYIYPADCLKIKRLCAEVSGVDLMMSGLYGTYGDNQYKLAESFNGIPNEIRVILGDNGKPTGQRAILCDLEDAIMVYVRQITDPNMFPPTFVEALAFKLAKRLAPIFNTDLSWKSAAQNDYLEAETTAKKASANEAVERDWDIGGYVRARQGR